mmetsp:Transcript_94064/g.130657  ORF Transcript_94064/g.130657 Transcript_94064/m.130657 type:complete len:86 (+) Transcript_94064:605-862(+)
MFRLLKAPAIGGPKLSIVRGVACGERGESLALRALCGSLGVGLALRGVVFPRADGKGSNVRGVDSDAVPITAKAEDRFWSSPGRV